MTTQNLNPNLGHRPLQRVRGLSLLAGLALAVSALSPAAFAHDRAHDRTHNRQHGHQHRTFGRVIDVRPVYRQVVVREPRQQCSHRSSRHGQRHSSHAAQIFGSIAGGVIGNSLSRAHSQRGDSRRTIRGDSPRNSPGNSQEAWRGKRHGNSSRHVDHGHVGATIGGAILGAAIGHEISRAHNNRGRHAGRNTHRGRHCVEVFESHRQRQFDHYKVTYVYQGRRFVTTTQHRPGNRIEIHRPSRHGRR